jgi:hypothetical protein
MIASMQGRDDCPPGRKQPREPFWGPGLPFFIIFLVSMALELVLQVYGEMGPLSASMISAVVTGMLLAIYEQSV